MRKARTRSTVIAVVLGLLLMACSLDQPQSALDPQGPYARDPHNLFVVVFWIAVAVFVLVQGLILYAAVKYRAKPDDDTLPVQVHGNTKLEILWTLIPALILAGIAVPTVRMVFELAAETDDAVTIEVIGHRWWFEYRYPDHGDIVTANELVIPVGVPVRLEMTAEETGLPDRGVLHSFWIPKLGGKQDLVPGRITTLNLLADEPGRYLGQCAEYCGLSHANMRARAVALSDGDWQAWLENQQSPAVTPEDGLAAQGAELFGNLGDRRSCVSCHNIRTEGGEPGAAVGPDLTHLMSREEFAGAIFELNEENLQQWLADPPAMKPMQPETGIGMPDLGLTPEEIDALVAYLLTLE
ncbi:MAG: cytochrome c oxidase subunit II [Actinobacteria bacterium]|nr:cytochrome c oxidase subunit II [Actinomycetota bacterium]